MSDDFDQRCRSIASHFLLTAVIVDDEPYFDPPVGHSPKTPGRSHAVGEDVTAAGPSRSRQSLDARTITNSFAQKGLICGVIAPPSEVDDMCDVSGAVLRADVIVVDWQLHRDDGRSALLLLQSILAADSGQRLRLIAVYTGEPAIGEIGAQIVEKLRPQYKFDSGSGPEHNVVLSHEHCRIAIYAKSGTALEPELQDRSVSEEDLPGQLIGDFACMVEGLLPSIALTALTAVRENAHRVLDKFETKLDPAFLTHRSCLLLPDDSQQHMTAQLASELHAIMDEAVVEKSPAGMDAIEQWLTQYKSNGTIAFGSDISMTHEDTVCMLRRGLDNMDNLSLKQKKRFPFKLSLGFARPEDGCSKDLDLQLAWMMCFRAVDAPEKRLWMGTAVQKHGEPSDDSYFLCMRPRCDSVRLNNTESFLLLPLVDHKPHTFQLVVRSGQDSHSYRRVSVCTDMSKWLLVDFEPDSEAMAVVAKKESASYFFKDASNKKYEWIGELKAEFAQSLAQSFASTLSRVALDKSEWLRRSEKIH